MSEIEKEPDAPEIETPEVETAEPETKQEKAEESDFLKYAKKLGYVDPEKFRGDKSTLLSPEDFVEKQEKSSKNLQKRIDSLETTLKNQEQRHIEREDRIRKESYATALQSLKAQHKEAVSVGNEAAADAIADRMGDVKAEMKIAETQPQQQQTNPNGLHPAAQQFIESNSEWWGVNPAATAAAQAMHKGLLDKGEGMVESLVKVENRIKSMFEGEKGFKSRKAPETLTARVPGANSDGMKFKNDDEKQEFEKMHTLFFKDKMSKKEFYKEFRENRK